MFQAFLVCQLVWLSSSSFVNPKPSGDTDHVLETQQHGEGNISDNLCAFNILLFINLDLPVRRIVATEFYEENATLVLQHEDATRNVDQQATNGGQECIGSKKRSQECGMAKCPSILYLSESALVWLPSLLPVEGCSVPPYPIPSLHAAVSGIVDNKLTICGGEWSIF